MFPSLMLLRSHSVCSPGGQKGVLASPWESHVWRQLAPSKVSACGDHPRSLLSVSISNALVVTYSPGFLEIHGELGFSACLVLAAQSPRGTRRGEAELRYLISFACTKAWWRRSLFLLADRAIDEVRGLTKQN